jgi:hypothetical protein
MINDDVTLNANLDKIIKFMYNNKLYSDVYNNIKNIIVSENNAVTINLYNYEDVISFEKFNENRIEKNIIIDKLGNSVNLIYRQSNELSDMWKDNYVKFLKLNDIELIGDNKKYNMLKYVAWRRYKITPNVMPIFENDLILIYDDASNTSTKCSSLDKNMYTNQADIIYDSDKCILGDLIDLNMLSGFMIINSINLGSNPENMHCHITNKNLIKNEYMIFLENSEKKYDNDGIKMYYIVDNITKMYFFILEKKNDVIEKFKYVFPLMLKKSLINKHKKDYIYFPQFIILPYNKINIRIIVLFKKVKKELYQINKINKSIDQIFYDQVFGNSKNHIAFYDDYKKTMNIINFDMINIPGNFILIKNIKFEKDQQDYSDKFILKKMKQFIKSKNLNFNMLKTCKHIGFEEVINTEYYNFNNTYNNVIPKCNFDYSKYVPFDNPLYNIQNTIFVNNNYKCIITNLKNNTINSNNITNALTNKYNHNIVYNINNNNNYESYIGYFYDWFFVEKYNDPTKFNNFLKNYNILRKINPKIVPIVKNIFAVNNQYYIIYDLILSNINTFADLEKKSADAYIDKSIANIYLYISNAFYSLFFNHKFHVTNLNEYNKTNIIVSNPNYIRKHQNSYVKKLKYITNETDKDNYVCNILENIKTPFLTQIDLLNFSQTINIIDYATNMTQIMTNINTTFNVDIPQILNSNNICKKSHINESLFYGIITELAEGIYNLYFKPGAINKDTNALEYINMSFLDKFDKYKNNNAGENIIIDIYENINNQKSSKLNDQIVYGIYDKLNTMIDKKKDKFIEIMQKNYFDTTSDIVKIKKKTLFFRNISTSNFDEKRIIYDEFPELNLESLSFEYLWFTSNHDLKDNQNDKFGVYNNYINKEMNFGRMLIYETLDDFDLYYRGDSPYFRTIFYNSILSTLFNCSIKEIDIRIGNLSLFVLYLIYRKKFIDIKGICGRHNTYYSSDNCKNTTFYFNEYIIFNPYNHLKLVGVLYYNPINYSLKMYLNVNDWLNIINKMHNKYYKNSKKDIFINNKNVEKLYDSINSKIKKIKSFISTHDLNFFSNNFEKYKIIFSNTTDNFILKNSITKKFLIDI